MLSAMPLMSPSLVNPAIRNMPPSTNRDMRVKYGLVRRRFIFTLSLLSAPRCTFTLLDYLVQLPFDPLGTNRVCLFGLYLGRDFTVFVQDVNGREVLYTIVVSRFHQFIQKQGILHMVGI